MERKPTNLYINIMDNIAAKSFVYEDKSAVIMKPIFNVDGKNPSNPLLSDIRKNAMEISQKLDIPFFYHNHDLEEEVIKVKREMGLLPKNN